MKIVLVTSQVTYVQENYLNLLTPFLASNYKHVVGLIILKNLNLSTMAKALGVRFTGAPKMSNTLLKNIADLANKKREKLCAQYGIPVKYFNSMNDAEAIQWVKEQDTDLVVNMRTRCIYKNEILNAPHIGCINIHHGILPDFRGTFCDLHALAEGKEAGFSIHQMTAKIDHGRILHVEVVSNGTDKDYMAYLARSGAIEAKALSKVIKDIEKNGLQGEPNISPKPIFTKNPTQEGIKKMLAQGMIL